MSKRDELLKASGANILPGMGAGQGNGLPAGLDPTTAMKRPAHLEGLSKEGAAARIAIDRIVRDEDQPRTEFEDQGLARLAESLRTRGQLQPIRLRWDEGRWAYVLIMGEGRWKAARLAGLAELSCIVHEDPLGPNDRLAIQLVENCLRFDLQPFEQARAYRRLTKAQGWSARQLAAELATNPATVTRALALLDLPEAVQEQVKAGHLAPHTAYDFTKPERPEDQAVVARAAVEQRLTRTEVDELVPAVRARKLTPEAKPEPVTVDLGDGTVVTIKWKRANSVTPVQALRRATRQVQDQELARRPSDLTTGWGRRAVCPKPRRPSKSGIRQARPRRGSRRVPETEASPSLKTVPPVVCLKPSPVCLKPKRRVPETEGACA